MLTVHKFPLEFRSGSDSIRLPKGAKPLHYAMQSGVLMVWCEVDTTAPSGRLNGSLLEVAFFGTGHPIGQMAENFEYQTTVMPVEGLVLHIYARLS